MHPRIAKHLALLLCSLVIILGTARIPAADAIQGNQQQCPPPPPVSTSDRSSVGSGTGSHRGSSTITILRAIGTLIEVALGLPPASLTGKSYPVSTDTPEPTGHTISGLEKSIICDAQKMLDRHEDFADGQPLIAAMISTELLLPIGDVHAMLKDNSACSDTVTMRSSLYGSMRRTETLYDPWHGTFTVDATGTPVSANPIWNACIRRSVYLDHSGNPYNCRRYHSGNHWGYPDIAGLEFSWNPRDPRGIALPQQVQIIVLNEEEVEMRVALRD